LRIVTAGIRRVTTMLIAALLTVPGAACADWLFMPFVGGAFSGQSALPDIESASGSTQLILGGSVALLSDGLLGVEADIGYAPRFFEADNFAGNIVSSNAATVSGSVIVATPLSVSQYSLRPYLVGGLSLMHRSVDEGVPLLGLSDDRENSIGFNVGGGAIGFLSPRTGVRFELRHFRSLEREEDRLTGDPTTLLSFWRATVGVVIRY
jgi:hypothetical protein